MHRPFSALRKRSSTRELLETTFCETHGEVCTPLCRHEADLNRYRRLLQRDGLIRF